MPSFSTQGVVWDFDGTILDSFKLFEDTITEVMQRRGMVVPSHEVFVHNYHGHLRDSIAAICDVHGSLLEAIFEEFIITEERHYASPDALYFGDALDLLRRNHRAGLKQVIVSNRTHHFDARLGSPRNLAQKQPLAGLVDIVVCGDDNEFYKPDARMLDEVERILGLTRSKLLVIGDQYVDAELAYNLGASAVLVSRSAQDVPHLDKLKDGWRDQVTIVKSLADVSVSLVS